VQQAAELTVAAPTIAASLDGRYMSACKDERVAASKFYAELGLKVRVCERRARALAWRHEAVAVSCRSWRSWAAVARPWLARRAQRTRSQHTPHPTPPTEQHTMARPPRPPCTHAPPPPLAQHTGARAGGWRGQGGAHQRRARGALLRQDLQLRTGACACVARWCCCTGSPSVAVWPRPLLELCHVRVTPSVVW
jgi:hypothetical protein